MCGRSQRWSQMCPCGAAVLMFSLGARFNCSIHNGVPLHWATPTHSSCHELPAAVHGTASLAAVPTHTATGQHLGHRQRRAASNTGLVVLPNHTSVHRRAGTARTDAFA